MSFQRRLYTPVPHSHHKNRNNLLVVHQNTVQVTNPIETPCIEEKEAHTSTTILDIEPIDLTRADLIKWATHYPHIKRKSTSTANLLQLYLTIERQNLEENSRLKQEKALAFKNRKKEAAAKRLRIDACTKARLLNTIPFLDKYGHLFTLENTFDRTLPTVQLTTTHDSLTSLNPNKSHNSLQKRNSTPQLSPIRKKIKVNDSLQEKRLALALRSALKPVNILYTRRQNERATRFAKLIFTVNSCLALYFNHVRSKSQRIIVAHWKRYNSIKKWAQMTHPRVVRGLTSLRKIVARYQRSKDVQVVTKFLSAASFVNSFHKLMAKLRWKVIKIQRAWRTYVAVTHVRCVVLQMKWVSVERQYKKELLEVIKRYKNMVKLVNEQQDVHKEEKILPKIQTKKGKGQFNVFVRRVKGSLRNGKHSPACFGGGDVSGLTCRVAKLMSDFETTCVNSFVSHRRKKRMNRIKRRKQEETLRKSNKMVKSYVVDEVEEPPAVLVAVDVRRKHCHEILTSARKQWRLNNKNNTATVNNIDVHSQKQPIKFNTCDILQLLQSSKSISKVIQTKQENKKASRMVKDDGHRLFFSLSDKHLLQRMTTLVKTETNRAEYL